MIDCILRPGKVSHPPLACLGHVGENHETWLVVRDNGGNIRQLYQDASGSSNCPLAWSPDGGSIYHSHENRLLAVNLANGQVRCLWTGNKQEKIVWTLECCANTGRLLYRISALPREDSRLMLAQPDGQHQEIHRGDFFTCSSSVTAGASLLAQRRGLVRLDHATGGTIPVMAIAPSDFALSPDGQKLAYCEKGVRIADLLLSSKQCHVAKGTCLSWSPDGRSLAFMVDDTELWLWDRADLKEPSEPRKLAWVPGKTYMRSGSYARPPVWSENGRYLMASLTRTTPNSNPRPKMSAEEEAEILAHLREQLGTDVVSFTQDTGEFSHEHASILIDLEQAAFEVWPGHRRNAAFQPLRTSKSARRQVRGANRE